jgi:hypothetical protein
MPHKDPEARRVYAREYARAWRAANREKHRAYIRERYAATDGARNMREWREKLPEEKRKALARESKAAQKANNPNLYAYIGHKKNAKMRGNAFLLTFEEWLDIWTESGKFEQRGRGSLNYCMARHGDVGPYAIGNVRICTNRENIKEGAVKKYSVPVSVETRKKMSDAQKARWTRVCHGVT